MGAGVVLSSLLPSWAVAAHASSADSLRAIADSLRNVAEVAGARADSAWIASGGGLPPQRDLGDVLSGVLGRTPPEPRAVVTPTPGLSVLILPAIGYNPAYGAYFGASASANGWLGDPFTTDISVFALGANYSTTGQTSVQFRADAWLPGNTWRFGADWRYLDTSQPTYGLGPTNTQLGEYPMDFELVRFYQQAYRHVGGPFYAGVGFQYDRHQDIVDERAQAGEQTPFSVYSRGTPRSTNSSGLSVNILVDTRDNSIYATRGVYWNAGYTSRLSVLGSDRDWQELMTDFRAYPSFPPGSRNTLALWTSMWFTFGPAPYLDLPAIGWDKYGKTGRGYIQGRIRAEDLVYNEAEYRMVFTDDGLWGGVVFANLTATTPPGGGFGRLDPGVGVGLRVKFIKRTRTNLTFDYGWGNAQSNGLYLGAQEIF